MYKITLGTGSIIQSFILTYLNIPNLHHMFYQHKKNHEYFFRLTISLNI